MTQVDSKKADYEVNIKLKIKNETPDKAAIAYKINKIVVYPNFSIARDSIGYKKEDIVQYKDFTIIDSVHTFNPRVFDRAL